MRALTIHQPWAWAIVHGPKRIENRSWSTNVRGWFAIHAGKSTQSYATHHDVVSQLIGRPLPSVSDLPFGAIVGVARLVGCSRIESIRDPWAFGPWCWQLDDVHPLERPLPCKGLQGWWSVPLAEVCALLPIDLARALRSAGRDVQPPLDFCRT